MLNWLLRRVPFRQKEARWTVVAHAGAIIVTDDRGRISRVDHDDISAVLVQTDDAGPWGTDMWWIVLGADGRQACTYPQGATGGEAVLGRLMALDGFDLQGMADAMGSTGDALFPLWRRQAGPDDRAADQSG